MTESTSDQDSTGERQAKLLRLATLASVLTAVLLIGAKTLAVLATGSVSLLASLVDSLMDAAASLVNLIAVRYALLPADRNHRFGHGKAESLAAFLQSIFIVASSGFLIHEAVHRLFEPQTVRAQAIGITVMLLSIAATLGLVSLQRYVIQRTQSAAIQADSLHYQADLLGNAAVLIALFASQWGFTVLDPILALCIAAYLLFSTRSILRQALNELLDRELPERTRNRILAVAAKHPAVLGTHDLRTRRAGRTVIVQLHIELRDNLPLMQAHRISDEVEAAIMRELPGADVVIHQDPVSLVEPRLDTQVAAETTDRTTE